MTAPPRRLIDDPEVSPYLRADLQEAAAHPGPSLDLDAALERFTHATRAVAPRRSRPLAVAVGTAVFVGATLAAALGGVWLSSRGAPGPTVPPSPAAPPPRAEVSAKGHAPPSPSAPSAAALPSAAPSGARAAGGAPSAIAEGRQALLKREVAQLAAIRAALGSAPARALALADAGHREFSAGTLYVEREALAISALTRLGRTAEARARGERLARAYPRHPYAEQVRRQTLGE